MKKIDPGHVLQKRLPGIRFSTWGFPRDYFPAAKNLLERKGSLYLCRSFRFLHEPTGGSNGLGKAPADVGCAFQWPECDNDFNEAFREAG